MRLHVTNGRCQRTGHNSHHSMIIIKTVLIQQVKVVRTIQFSNFWNVTSVTINFGLFIVDTIAVKSQMTDIVSFITCRSRRAKENPDCACCKKSQGKKKAKSPQKARSCSLIKLYAVYISVYILSISIQCTFHCILLSTQRQIKDRLATIRIKLQAPGAKYRRIIHGIKGTDIV